MEPAAPPSTAPPSKVFDALEVPLQGTVLVEAAAGAGKTYALTSVFLRLLLERKLPVESILVVTFSEAAGAELRLRLRDRLGSELACCEAGATQAAGDLAAEDLAVGNLNEETARLRAELWRRAGGVAEVTRLLRLALHTFDEAGICTIHALCRRVLSDYAPLHELPGRIEILPERDTPLLEEATDLWRREFYTGSELYASWAVANGCHPEWLAQSVEPWAGRPDLRWDRSEVPEMGPLERDCRQGYTALQAAWRHDPERLRDFLLDGPALNRARFKKGKTQRLLEELQGWLQADRITWPPQNLLRFMERLCPEALREACKKNQAPLQHPLFACCLKVVGGLQDFAAACALRRVALQQVLLERAADELWDRKRCLGRYTFQDLLNRLLKTLRAPGGEQLAATLRGRYRVALVDESQDTDPVQHEILRRIFQHQDAGAWFMVGDPKQAIYSFRGADLRVFLEARSQADACFHLQHNWRSAPRLVKAVNTIFGAAEDPFLLPEIRFRPAVPAPAATPLRLEVEGDSPAPFRLWLDIPPKRERASEQVKRVASAVAAEAVRLLNLGARGQAWLGEGAHRRPLRGDDIAFLVRTHTQAEHLRRCLRDLGVAGIVYGRDSVYDSPEAEELWRFLAAVYQPDRESCVRAALATELLGRNAFDLIRLGESEADWSVLLERFRGWRERWQNHGFIAMFREVLRVEGLPRRLLNLPDGERRLADLLQLGELLHEYERTTRASMGALLRHLANFLNPAAQGQGQGQSQGRQLTGEEEKTRLESDEKLMHILTMHRAKGQEFPIVFCPFPQLPRSDPRRDTGRLWLEHRSAARDHATLRFEEEPEEARHARRAEEHMRLSYVALTRAQCRCYLVWAPPSGKAPAVDALARLLSPRAAQGATAAAQDPYKKYRWLEREAKGSIQVEPLPAVAGSPWSPSEDRAAPKARVPPRKLPQPGLRIASYSLLVQHRVADPPDYDWDVHSTREEQKSLADNPSFPAAFPSGERAGHCLHALLEQVDFESCGQDLEKSGGEQTGGLPRPASVSDQSAPQRPRVESLVRDVLSKHGFISPKVTGQRADKADKAVAWACELLRRVLATELEARNGLRLGGLPRARRLDELGFDFHAAGLSPELLRELCERYAAQLPESLRFQVRNLEFSTVQACVTGRIDLVFEAAGRYYLVDYKSHLLGAESVDYAPEKLDAAMYRGGYGLQYLFYTLALHRYLRHRLPDYRYERHFGAVYYLFLRGMEPERAASGVWRTRLPGEFLEALDTALTKEKPDCKLPEPGSGVVNPGPDRGVDGPGDGVS